MAPDRLGGIPLLTAFTGLPGSFQLASILLETFAENCTLSWVEEQQICLLRDVRDALDTIHQQSYIISMRRNDKARGRQAAKAGVRVAKFGIGGFVLADTAVKGGNNLALHWRGPKRVIQSLNDFTFGVQDVYAPYAVTIRHASRLKFYRDSDRGVTEGLIAHVLRGEGGHLVDKLLNCQIIQQWERLVQWIGLDPEEASWEPAPIIIEDVPQLVQKFVTESQTDRLARRMWPALSSEDPIDEVQSRHVDRGRRKRRKPVGLESSVVCEAAIRFAAFSIIRLEET
ncbi:hypothetical protein PHMEG_00018717 [Phytophthora megakarya]|uniref:Chromo domain-containing protein n=1 Tax=Phytophthora megakarya TaxID=4795 RepID=A0A225VTQ8_9STRA|nr:hypothetical protein PHMEG_00018717 [Phytophthora megakarya]